MKKRLFRVLNLVLVLSIISFFIISSPVLAQSIAVTPNSGPVGTDVSVTGTGFIANVAYTMYFAYGTTYQSVVDTGTVSSSGTTTSSFNVPSVPAGTYTIRVQTSSGNAVATFVVNSVINLNVSSAIVGNQVTITGTGFNAGRTVTIRFDEEKVATSSTNNVGKFSASFTVPETYAGAHTITAADGVYTKTATLSVVQWITISPTSGSVGTTITVSGTGFRASRTITISYEGTNITTVPSTITTNSVGNFNAKFTVPAGPARTVQVKASDGTNVANTSFKLIAAVGLTPASGKVGTPVTIQGTGFNANRQVTITFDDNQVKEIDTDSYGSFTSSFNVPAAIGGQHPVTANDGVRSIGATFTIDSNLVVTPNSGKVGTPINVSGSGFRSNRTVNIYFNNVLMATTNSNNNGSFSIKFNITSNTGGAHTISVSDGSYTASSSFNVLPDVSLGQSGGEMGAQITVMGTGFNAGRTLTINLGTTQVKSTLTDVNGSFNDRFTVPQLDVGSYNLNVSDGTNMASMAFMVTSSFNISPTSGYVGSTITVKGGGYNGMISIKYDNNVVTTTAANADTTFSTSFVVPVSIYGYHTITVSDTATALQTTFSMESTPPPTPVILLPTKLSRENALPTFTWQGVTDPSGVTYNLQISSDANFNNIILEKKDLETTQYNILNTEKLKKTAKEKPYYWRVKAVDLASNSGQWSTSGSFYVSFIADWLKYTLIGLGAVIGVLIIFWLGMITGRRGWTRET